MRIFLICQQSAQDYPVPAYKFWLTYFRNGLSEAGHECVEAERSDWAKGLTRLRNDEWRRWLDQEWVQTIQAIKTEHKSRPIDLVLCYCFPQQVSPSAVKQIREFGIPCVNFFCDNVREFTEVPASFACFDAHWVPEAEARVMYASAGHTAIYAPMPVWVPPLERTIPQSETGEVLFIGSHDPLREDLLRRAVKAGLPLTLRGPGWTEDPNQPAEARSLWSRLGSQVSFVRRYGLKGIQAKLSYRRNQSKDHEWLRQILHPAVFGHDYFELTRSADVTLGINRYPSFRHAFEAPHAYSRLRDIEAPMLGACYLTEYAPGLEDLYELGTEIETYRSVEELVEKTHQLRIDPARRQRLRENGQRRALEQHTIGKSLEKIARHLGLPNAPSSPRES